MLPFFLINILMRVLEILLPKNTKDKDLSPKALRQIDFLQRRMDSYVDKILDPKTSSAGKEFLKSRLRDDYYELKDLLPHTHEIAENENTQYEVYDRKTGERVSGRGPYNSRVKARRAVDQLDNQYGGYRYGYRPIQPIKELFQQGADWEWVYRGSEERVADFKIGNIPYRFTASMASPKEPDIWELEFQSMDPKSRSNKDNFGLTGTGNAADVFSTVIDIIRSLLSDKSITVNVLKMTAIEDSRRKLYQRMIRRLLPNWDIQEHDVDIYATRPYQKLSEAVHKLPITDEDFEVLKELMNSPIPAAIAPIYIDEIINDDELNDLISSLEETHPSRDVRPLIVEWVNRVMPDQMYRFRDEGISDRKGILSPIHGYDPHIYKGTNDPITGNAYGYF